MSLGAIFDLGDTFNKEKKMKRIIILGAASLVGISAISYAAPEYRAPSLGSQSAVVEHGGGCRKTSPPGMCCHMDNSTGIVHCH